MSAHGWLQGAVVSCVAKCPYRTNQGKKTTCKNKKDVYISAEESCKTQKCDPGAQRHRTEQLDADQTETEQPDEDQVVPAGRLFRKEQP